MSNEKAFLNELKNEISPYLLQHATNPINWYPWGDKAFEKAKSENKPVLVSIGYSTCHWCHVMEKESFSDNEVAKVLNEHLVCIKVDREERPDLDNIYMEFCHLMTGRGGWPLNVFLTPQKIPFFTATYIPKNSISHHLGIIELVEKISSYWINEPEKLISTSEKVISMINNKQTLDSKSELNINLSDKAFDILNRTYDNLNGGFGDAPKFPVAHNIFFLLRYWKRTGNKSALNMAENTLSNMRLGGIFDQIDKGFHRYSTDNEWILPHFEKMLYDQALLTIAYLETYQATNNKFYADVAQETLSYSLNHLSHKNGGFMTGEDADSDDEEGKYYVWEEKEIKNILNEDEFLFAKEIFNLSTEGNYIDEATRLETGKNILYIPSKLQETLIKEKPYLDIIIKKLKKERSKRIKPFKDDKILTDWNGLMIAALAKAYQVLDDSQYLLSAKVAISFIYNNLIDKNGLLLHMYRDGQSSIYAYADDYAFLIYGLIELYEATFDVDYLKKSIKLMDEFIKYFWDNENKGFYFATNKKDLIVRKKEFYDAAIPCANSISISNLITLGYITGNEDYNLKANELLKIYNSQFKNKISPLAASNFLANLENTLMEPIEIVVSGEFLSQKTQEIIKLIRLEFIPNKILIFKENNQDEITDIAKFTKSQIMLNNETTVYVCKNYTCKHPINDIKELRELLNISL